MHCIGKAKQKTGFGIVLAWLLCPPPTSVLAIRTIGIRLIYAQ